MVNIISKENLIEKKLERRKRVFEQQLKAGKMKGPDFESAMETLEGGKIPVLRFPKGFDLSKVARKNEVGEFIGTGNFSSAWYERQRYEVEAGRDEEPILYTGIYDETVDATLPETLTVNTLGPAGVVFEEVKEGGEVKFVSVAEGTKTVTMFHYASGIRYSEKLFIFNQLFRLSNIDRRFGNAFNALKNHIHFSPILTAAYGSSNQTDGTALTNFRQTAPMPEKYLRTIEAAIVASISDQNNPRRGPYVLVIGSGDIFTVERALTRVPQEGFDDQSSANNRIRGAVAYDGWTGSRGKKNTSYAGVTSGKGYLIDLSFRMEDFQSYVKQGLRRQTGDGDLSRFILSQTIWDSWFGAFAAPTRAVQEITWPLPTSGQA